MYLDELDDNKEAHEIDRLIIGKFCSIATGVKIMMGGTQEHNYNWISTYPLSCFDENYDIFTTIMPKGQILKGDTIIGNDVWIGAESMIMPGVQIADGAVIATRSVVTKNVGPYEIWGGHPAKLIKKRFTDDKIEKLLQLKWWDWDDATIKTNLDLLQSDQIDALWNLMNKPID
jgi:chloramphenicol O-acetyltransferase type B